MPSVKNKKQYEALLAQGYSEAAAARITNSPPSGKAGDITVPYEKYTKSELYKLAKKLDIEGRSSMSKKELIKSLQDQ